MRALSGTSDVIVTEFGGICVPSSDGFLFLVVLCDDTLTALLVFGLRRLGFRNAFVIWLVLHSVRKKKKKTQTGVDKTTK
jgi:hypothetical protein